MHNYVSKQNARNNHLCNISIFFSNQMGLKRCTKLLLLHPNCLKKQSRDSIMPPEPGLLRQNAIQDPGSKSLDLRPQIQDPRSSVSNIYDNSQDFSGLYTVHFSCPQKHVFAKQDRTPLLTSYLLIDYKRKRSLLFGSSMDIVQR